jgi:hypothetical protein
LDRRARPRQQLRQRVCIGRVLVPIRAAHPFPELPDRAALRPPLPPVYDEARDAFFGAVKQAMPALSGPELLRVARIGETFYAGKYRETLGLLRGG